MLHSCLCTRIVPKWASKYLCSLFQVVHLFWVVFFWLQQVSATKQNRSRGFGPVLGLGLWPPKMPPNVQLLEWPRVTLSEWPRFGGSFFWPHYGHSTNSTSFIRSYVVLDTCSPKNRLPLAFVSFSWVFTMKPWPENVDIEWTGRYWGKARAQITKKNLRAQNSRRIRALLFYKANFKQYDVTTSVF